MKSNFILLSVVAFVAMTLTACGSSDSEPLKPLAAVYAELGVNNKKLSDAYQSVYKADRGEQEALMQKAMAVAEEVKAANEKLAEEAASLGEGLLGQPIKCEMSELAGYTLGVATLTTVEAMPNFANLVVTAPLASGMPEKSYCLFVDSDGKCLTKTMGYCQDGKITVNFRLTPKNASVYAPTVKLLFVGENEYKSGAKSSEAVAESTEPMKESDAEEEVEPAFSGEGMPDASSDAVVSESVTFEKGANLKETLAKAKHIEWEYNADMGVGATVGKIYVTIPEEDLTAKGQEVINALTSDIELGIKFSVDYIKPSATLQIFEVNE